MDKKEEDIALGERIRNIRLGENKNNKHYKQKEFAKLVNATVSLVSNWENGRNKPNRLRLKLIAELGDLNVDELLTGVAIKKIKKGTPTVIEYEGRRYILEHKDQYRGNKHV